MIHLDPARLTPTSAMTERQLDVLTRLVDIGMEIAEAAGRAATAPDGPEAARMPDPALVYSRVARAVRLTIALQSRLTAERAAAETERNSARRVRLSRLVERAVEADHEVEPLSWDVRERLTDADLDAELEGLSFTEVVARICRDLRLSPDRTAAIVAAASPDEPPPAAPPSPRRRAKPQTSARLARPPAARPRAPPH